MTTINDPDRPSGVGVGRHPKVNVDLHRAEGGAPFLLILAVSEWISTKMIMKLMYDGSYW